MERDGRWHPGLAVLLARKIDGMTQAELAERVGLTQGQLSRLERMESAFTWEHMQMFSEAQARALEWYVYGPSNAQRSDGSNPGSPNSGFDNPIEARVNSMSNEEIALARFGIRTDYPAAKDIEPAEVTRIHTPGLFERYVDLTVEKQPA